MHVAFFGAFAREIRVDLNNCACYVLKSEAALAKPVYSYGAISDVKIFKWMHMFPRCAVLRPYSPYIVVQLKTIDSIAFSKDKVNVSYESDFAI